MGLVYLNGIVFMTSETVIVNICENDIVTKVLTLQADTIQSYDTHPLRIHAAKVQDRASPNPPCPSHKRFKSVPPIPTANVL